METNEEAAGTATAASSSPSLEELRKSAVPPHRQPGVCRRKRIVCNEIDWERALQHLKDSMGEYCALGFDVECINVNNPRQFHYPTPPELYRDRENNVIDGMWTPSTGNSRWRPGWEQQGQSAVFVAGTSPDFVIGRDGQRSPYPGKAMKGSLSVPVLPTPQHKKRRKEVSVLVQLASWSGVVVMLRLCFWRSIPDSLREFLSDRRYLKLGVGIEQDAQRLFEDWGLELHGWIDLRHICIDMCLRYNDYPMRQMGLKKLAESLFGASAVAYLMPSGLKKTRTIAWSDWNALRLKEEQIRYASWDAQIAVDIFSLCTQRLYQLSAPQREDKTYYDDLYKKCAHFLDVPPTRHPRQPGDDNDDYESDDYVSTSKENSVAGDDDDLSKLYNNCRIHAQETGNRGFLTEPVVPPTEAACTGAEEKATPAKTIGAVEKAGKLPTIAVEIKQDKLLDHRSCYSVAISSMNKTNGIAVITLNNSPKNVLDFNMAKSLVGSLRSLEDDRDCRAVIIASACSNTFSVGYDLKEFRNADPRRIRAYWAAIFDLWFHLYKSRLATVAAINGVASGGGFVMAACCDRRIMASDCGGVGFSEIKLGITLPLWIISRVTQLAGYPKAEFVLTRGHLLNAQHAIEYGLIDRLSSKDRLLDTAFDELEKILDTPDYPRVSVKWVMRRQLLDKALQERERCIEALTENVTAPQVQDLIRRVCSQKHK